MSDVGKAEKIRIIVEVTSAIAVVASLIFLALEVRQSGEQAALNARAIQVATYQDLIGQIADLNNLTIENPEWAALQSRLGRDPDSVTDPVERQQYAAFFYLLLRHGDMAFHQYENGMLTRERLDSALKPLTARLRFPMVRAHWQANRQSFAVGYQALLDSLIATESF